MYSFFYNLMATLTGGKSFEEVRKQYLNKTKKILKGAKFSNIDTQVFTLLTQRKHGESFFKYYKRSRRLNQLSIEDKQRLINSEKKRLTKIENEKKSMLKKLIGNESATEKQGIQELQNQTIEATNKAINRKLNKIDASIFNSLSERQKNESVFAFLKRNRTMYQLSVEDKQKLVNKEKSRINKQQQESETMLQNYIELTPQEKIHEEQTLRTRQVNEQLSKEKQSQDGDLSL